MTVGDNIKRIAEEKGLTMYRIAKQGEISNSYISEIVSNKRKNPSITIIKKIASVLNVTIDELVS
ncbi:helix-turn-helix domain-containing protein [Clostridium sp. CX1]|uniref:helix-turn-helix domain-containing protein n=1 Tax=Clostridium sp. CX1 TaxID=2978346 RepID=UPI0021C045A5|nr:helix-turn-helix transcriptional regulator [Clostridium sp. CX1]MCT8978272.1 helix-turn-helix domain-containing protein [Clostridium sp. CX1]